MNTNSELGTRNGERQVWILLLLFLLLTPLAAQQEPAKQQDKKQDAQKPSTSKDPLPPGEGHDLVSTSCSMCHTIDAVTRHRETEDRWKQYVDDMIVRGTKLSPAESKIVVAYLTKHFAPVATPSTPPNNAVQLADGDGKDLVVAKCTVCHDLERVPRVYRDKQGWEDLVANMISRGAEINADEAKKIQTYLFAHYGIQ
jgi:cytochrome c5